MNKTCKQFQKISVQKKICVHKVNILSIYLVKRDMIYKLDKNNMQVNM